MKSEDTPMWNDPSEPAYVRELLHAGRTEPVGYDVASGLAKHLANVQAGAPLPHWAQAGASAGAAVGSSAWLSWLVLPVVAATAATGLWFATHATNTKQLAPAVQAPAPIAVVSAAPAVQPEVLAAPDAEPAAQAPVAAIEPTSSAVASAKMLRSAHRPLRARDATQGAAVPSAAHASNINAKTVSLDTDRLMSAPVAANAVHTSQPSAAEPATADSAAVAQPAAATAATAQADKAGESRLEREMQMLAVAQRVLTTDPARALRLAEQGEREFPRTMFSAERQQVGMLALVKLGRLNQARRIGTPFLAKYPNAPWSARLRRALATGRVE